MHNTKLKITWARFIKAQLTDLQKNRRETLYLLILTSCTEKKIVFLQPEDWI